MQYRGQKPDKWEGLPLLILKYITSYIVDIGRFVFEPKKYLDEVSMESPVSICKRLIILAMGFDFIVLSLFYVIFGTPIFKDPFSLLPKLFGIALLETALGLILVPPFLLTGAICKSKPGVKKSITYVLTFKFVYFLIPVILYSLYIVH